MSSINAAMNQIFSWIWMPFNNVNPWVGLIVLSVVFGVLALLAMKYFSNQDRIVELKDRYKGHVLAIKLFRDDLGVVLSSLFRTLGLITLYLGHQLRPVAVMMIPFVLIFAQMQMRLAYKPVAVGDELLVTVELEQLEPGLAGSPDVTLESTDAVTVMGKAPRVPSAKKVVFPIRVEKAGVHELNFRVNEERVTKSLHVDNDGLVMVSPVRSSGFGDLILYPTESAFDDGSEFARISMQYPVRPLPALGIDWSFGMELGMGLTFVVISIVAAFLLKGFFGVTI